MKQENNQPTSLLEKTLEMVANNFPPEAISKSPTLTALFTHWTDWPEDSEGHIDLPFNVEQFCRENDKKIEALKYYADPANWNSAVSGHGESSQDRIKDDGGYYGPAGEHARKALGIAP